MIRLGFSDGSSGIVLSEGEYYQLHRMREDISDFFQTENATPTSTFFEGSTNKRIELEIYKGRKILNIREMTTGNGVNYGMLFPTKNGFAIGSVLWEKLLGEHQRVEIMLKESKKIFQAIKENVILQLTALIKDACNGCRIDHPSQLQHECITEEWCDRVELNFPNAVSNLNIDSITDLFNKSTFLSFEFCRQMITKIVLNSKQYLRINNV